MDTVSLMRRVNFKLGLKDLVYDFITSEEYLYLIDEALRNLVKEKYLIFEQNQRAIDDLQPFITEDSLIADVTNAPEYTYTLPDDYWFRVGEKVLISYTDSLGVAQTVYQGVTETTLDKLNYALENPYSGHIFRYERAKPLRLISGGEVILITDGNYTIAGTPTETYKLKYIKKPTTVTFNVEIPDMPDHLLEELIYKIIESILPKLPKQAQQGVNNKQ